MANPLLERRRETLVGASILSADFAHIGRDSRDVLGAGADFLHVDVMDGHFVPNLTMGPDMCRALSREFPGTLLDVHLMIENPASFFEAFAKAGAGHVTFHAEAEPDIRVAAGRARDLGLSVGAAINPPTPAGTLLPHLDALDLVLVMSVNPGFSGQSFHEQVLAKVRTLREAGGPDLRIEMDGGISPETADRCREAGCDVLASASAIFARPRAEWAGVIGTMRGS